MDLTGLLWGVLALAFIGGIVALYRWEMREKAKTGAVPTPSQIAAQVQSAVASGLQDIPRIVSDEVQRLEADGAALLARAQKAEADFADEHAASIARLDATGAAVIKALSDLGALGAADAAALAAQFLPDFERMKTEMSQAVQDAVNTLVATYEAKLSAASQPDQAALDAAHAAGVQEESDADVAIIQAATPA